MGEEEMYTPPSLVSIHLNETGSGNRIHKSQEFEQGHLELEEVLMVFEQALAGAGFVLEGKELRLVNINTEE